VIRLELFETIRLWHAQGMATRQIARRLGVCPKTVRRHLAKIDGGALAPQRATPPSMLEPFLDRLAELTAAGRTAWSIYEELQGAGFSGCYDTVKRAVRQLRHRDPKVYERLEHPPGAEAQVDFTELSRVEHQGRRVRTWCFQMIWPHSRWRYLEVVLDQTVPTFLGCIQRAIQASEAIPQRLVPDNLTSAVLRRQMGLRPYQRDFATFCAHYGMAPAPARPRTPTDKGSVERGNGTLKQFLRGRQLTTLEDLRQAVSHHQRAVNARPHSQTGKVPDDLLALERRGPLPEAYPLARWSEHRVRSDCHVQVLRNFYSVPYRLAGKKVVVRVDDDQIVVYDELIEVARHPRCGGRGETRTDRAHYPAHKRLATQEIRAQRVARVRAVGLGAAQFLHGLNQSREYVHHDLMLGLLRLIDRHDPAVVELACRRAAHFGNYSLLALQQIIDRRLYELPLDDLSIEPAHAPPALEIVRPLQAYAAIFGGLTC